MLNPWTGLPERPPFVLAEDLPMVEAHNLRRNAEHQFRLEALPEPYLGPIDAPVVLLNLNPGFDPSDLVNYAVSPEVRAASIAAGILDEVFADAATRARELVQAEIQKKAQEFFLKVSANPDYAGLVLDSAYKVAVVDDKGNPVIEPLSGYRQLLVLSLVSALMRTSPEAGPVVMDMPFGRLDPQRTSDVLRSLPRLSEQVVIFVFPEEAGSTALQDLGANVYAIHDIVFRGLYDSAVTRRQVYTGTEVA